MKAGECWVFDSWLQHRVVNGSDETRIHLVLDTAGSSRFWSMLDQLITMAKNHQPEPESQHFQYVPGKPTNIMLEKYNVTPVLSPGEVDGLVADIVNEIAENPDNEKQHVMMFEKAVTNFCKDWRTLFSVFGYEEQGFNQYLHLMKKTKAALDSMNFELKIARNGQSARIILYSRVYSATISPMVRDSHFAALRPHE